MTAAATTDQHVSNKEQMMNDRYESIRLSGLFTALSPISHIGESVSTGSYLVQDPVVQPDGTVAEVFSYSGNAWRGQLRDLMARRLAVALDMPLPPFTFHLLFSGGRLDGADKKVDLELARSIRGAVPMVSLLGGGVGTEILAGRLRVFNAYPLCVEAIPVLPGAHHEEAARTRYGALVFEKQFSRKDDGKGGHHAAWLAEAEAPRNPKAVSDQMRMMSELIAPGARLHTEIHGTWISPVELGCLVAAIHDFGASPCIGGQANKGHGLVDLRYDLIADSREFPDFIRVDRDGVHLSAGARDAMRAYEGHLVERLSSMKDVLGCAA